MFHHTLCTPGAYASAVAIAQHSDRPREDHDKSRLQSEYSSTELGSENHDGPWRYNFPNPNTPRASAPAAQPVNLGLAPSSHCLRLTARRSAGEAPVALHTELP